ncbi:MAG: hypothetical protein JXA22_01275 [Candidatus Thermoplasmatota archaeon]|nr:hypothetical protein [Candidatus Thermoplasmatota archaeon]
MEGNMEGPELCTVCREQLNGPDDHGFGGAPVCNSCKARLNLEEMDTTRSDERLHDIMETQGQAVLGEFLALARTVPREYGWNILAIVGRISDDIKDERTRSMVENSTILCGLTVVRSGEGEEAVDPGLLSLFLVLGQVIDLSIMRRVVIDGGLRMSNKLDEMILIGEHNRVLFDLLTEIDHGEDPQKELILASCLERII